MDITFALVIRLDNIVLVGNCMQWRQYIIQETTINTILSDTKNDYRSATANN